MKYLFTIVLAATMIATSGCVAEAGYEDEIVVTQEAESFDPDTDYMSAMIKAAVANDEDALSAAVSARNDKIVSMGIETKALTVDEFLYNFRSYAGFDFDRDYLAEMMVCAETGNVEHGRVCAEERWLKIQAAGLDDENIDFDELLLLAKIITSEAGSNWLSMEWKMAVGEVLLNRVASPEFPNTLKECVYQPGQYSGSNSSRFANLTPYPSCIEAAARLLSGERVLNAPSVVFQANFRQGSGVYLKLTDSILGDTYLCYSSHRELYE